MAVCECCREEKETIGSDGYCSDACRHVDGCADPECAFCRDWWRLFAVRHPKE